MQHYITSWLLLYNTGWYHATCKIFGYSTLHHFLRVSYNTSSLPGRCYATLDHFLAGIIQHFITSWLVLCNTASFLDNIMQHASLPGGYYATLQHFLAGIMQHCIILPHFCRHGGVYKWLTL